MVHFMANDLHHRIGEIGLNISRFASQINRTLCLEGGKGREKKLQQNYWSCVTTHKQNVSQNVSQTFRQLFSCWTCQNLTNKYLREFFFL